MSAERRILMNASFRNAVASPEPDWPRGSAACQTMVLMSDIPARINVQATVMDAVPRMTDLTGHSSHIETSPLLSFKRWFNSSGKVQFMPH